MRIGHFCNIITSFSRVFFHSESLESWQSGLTGAAFYEKCLDEASESFPLETLATSPPAENVKNEQQPPEIELVPPEPEVVKVEAAAELANDTPSKIRQLQPLQRLRSLFGSKDKATYDLEVKPKSPVFSGSPGSRLRTLVKEDSVDSQATEVLEEGEVAIEITHISNQFQIPVKDLELTDQAEEHYTTERRLSLVGSQYQIPEVRDIEEPVETSSESSPKRALFASSKQETIEDVNDIIEEAVDDQGLEKPEPTEIILSEENPTFYSHDNIVKETEHFVDEEVILEQKQDPELELISDAKEPSEVKQEAFVEVFTEFFEEKTAEKEFQEVEPTLEKLIEEAVRPNEIIEEEQGPKQLIEENDDDLEDPFADDFFKQPDAVHIKFDQDNNDEPRHVNEDFEVNFDAFNNQPEQEEQPESDPWSNIDNDAAGSVNPWATTKSSSLDVEPDPDSKADSFEDSFTKEDIEEKEEEGTSDDHQGVGKDSSLEDNAKESSEDSIANEDPAEAALDPEPEVASPDQASPNPDPEASNLDQASPDPDLANDIHEDLSEPESDDQEDREEQEEPRARPAVLEVQTIPFNTALSEYTTPATPDEYNLSYVPQQSFKPKLKLRKTSSSGSEQSVGSTSSTKSYKKKFRLKQPKFLRNLSLNKKKSQSLTDLSDNPKYRKDAVTVLASASIQDISEEQEEEIRPTTAADEAKVTLDYYAPPQSQFVRFTKHSSLNKQGPQAGSSQSLEALPVVAPPKRSRKSHAPRPDEDPSPGLDYVPRQSSTVRSQASSSRTVTFDSSTKTTRESKQKPLVQRAVRKSLKKLKSSELPNLNDTVKSLSSFKDTFKLRRSVQVEERFKVGKSSFFNTDIAESVLNDQATDNGLNNNDNYRSDTAVNPGPPQAEDNPIQEELDNEEFHDVCSNDNDNDDDLEAANEPIIDQKQKQLDNAAPEPYPDHGVKDVDNNSDNSNDSGDESETGTLVHHETPTADDIHFSPVHENEIKQDQDDVFLEVVPQEAIDSDSDTSFYSVQSELDKPGHVQFGSSTSLDKSVQDLEEFDLDQDYQDNSSLNMSPMKKLKNLFRTHSKGEYDLEHQPESDFDITKTYMDLPRVSVNPLFKDDEPVMEEQVQDSSEDDYDIKRVYPVQKTTR